MTKSKSLLLIAFLLSATLAAYGCTRTVHYNRVPGPPVQTKVSGPPPHAPAHGYRHKHPDGVVLVYESRIGVYVVRNHTDVYFHKDRYYRSRDGGWQTSVHIDGPWKGVAVKKVPPGLAKKSNSEGIKKGKSKKPKK